MSDPDHSPDDWNPRSSPDNRAAIEATGRETGTNAGQRSLVLDIVIDDDGWADVANAESAVMAAAAAVGARPELSLVHAEATLALSSDAEVSSLNGTYRGKPKPTNVLSFPAGPSPHVAPAAGGRFLGDIIVARETVLREAAAQNIPAVHHLQHLVVHGLLHLLGFDHESDQDAQIMEALEISILAGLGIPDPYLPDTHLMAGEA